MFGQSKASLQRRFIVNTSHELVPNIGDRANWTTPLLGSFALCHIEYNLKSKHFKPPYFELIAAGRVESSTQEFPEYHYFYDSKGRIFGVSQLYVPYDGWDNESITRAQSEIDFQIENRLTFPNHEDYNNVELYLKNGKLDNV